jgi:3-deoxy-D-manno-octulosonic-acid transferase
MTSRMKRIAVAGLRAAYNELVVPAAGIALPAAAWAVPKLAAYRRARSGWLSMLERRLEQRPDVAVGDALWVHAASAGESLQARALLTRLRSERPADPLVLTYVSPSAVPLLEDYHGADLVFPLPLDTRRNAHALLEALRPRGLALIDAELWPNLLREARRRSVRTALVSARLAADSWRSRLPARALYADMYRQLDLVGSVDEESAERFRDAGVPAERLRVTGDLRVDVTLERLRSSGPAPPMALPTLLPLVVAGSTWPDDEAVLFPALTRLRDRGLFFSLVAAPHEAGEKRLAALESALTDAGFSPRRWSRIAEDGTSEVECDALIIDRIGVLYRLYALAAAAYVGGGFRGAVHNVMEPAAAGTPVLTGPYTKRSWFADRMERAGCLFRVGDLEACAGTLEHLLIDAPSASQRAGGAGVPGAGERARQTLHAHAGAADRTVAALRERGWLVDCETGPDAEAMPGGPLQREAGTEALSTKRMEGTRSS